MTVVLPFIINAGMNFALGLLVALFLGPEAFGVYAIGAAILVLVNAALVDWLKLSAMRFYALETRETQPEIRGTLDVLAAGIVIVVSVLLVVLATSGIRFPVPVLLLSAAVAGGLCAGLFDFHGAIARARYLDMAYARLIVVKHMLSLLLMVGVAWASRDPTLVLLGGSASAAIALITVRNLLADAPLSWRNARLDLVWTFARYGYPLVWANVVYSLIPLINRSLLAASHGYAEAGYFSLSSDIGIRLFGTLAASIEILLLREVVRIERVEGAQAAQARIAANMTTVLMLLLPAATGLWLILPAFEQLFVPASFKGHFSTYMTILLPAFLALGLILAGLNPVFLIAKRTGTATLAAMAGLCATLAIAFAGPGALGPQLYALAQTAGFVTAFLVTAALALRALEARPSLRDFGAVLLANGAMVLVLLPFRGGGMALIEIVVLPVIGGLVYGACLLAANVGPSRAFARRLLGFRKRMA
jgi:O-antigen/teichoic acid export membrane protein